MIGHLTRQHYYRSCGLSHIQLSRCYVQECLSPTRCGARSTCKYRVTQADSVCKSFFMVLCRFVQTIQKRCCVFVQYVEWCLVWCRCCLAVLCAVVWCGSVTRCKAHLRRFYGFMVYSGLIALKWLYGACGASGRVSRCRHGVGCVVSLSLVWCCGLLCGSSGSSLAVGAVWSGCVSLAVSVALLVCCAWCCLSGAVVLSGVGLFSGVSGLVFWCMVIVCTTPKRSIHTKRRTT